MNYAHYLLCFCLLFSGTACWGATGTYCERSKQVAFNSEKWILTEQGRFRSLDSFLNSHHLIGMQKKKVRQLLGEPSKFSTKTGDKYPLEDTSGIACGQCPFTSFLIEYKSGCVYRYCVWQNPEFVKNYKYLGLKYFPDLRTDLSWHYK